MNKSEFIVAHNISFDEKILGAELLRKKVKSDFESKKKLCIMQASTNYCKIPGPYGFKWPKLSELHIKLFAKDFEDAVVRELPLLHPSDNPQIGTAIPVTGSSSISLPFYINNAPGTPLNPTFKVTRVDDNNGCDNTTDRITIDIKAMPKVGSFN